MNVKDALYEAMERAGFTESSMQTKHRIDFNRVGDRTKMLLTVKVAELCGFEVCILPQSDIPNGAIRITGSSESVSNTDDFVWAVESMRQVGTHLEAVFDNKRDALKALSKAADNADGWFRVQSFDMSDEKQKRALATALKMTEL